MKVLLRQEIEREIVGLVVTEGLSAGYSIAVDNGEEEFPASSKAAEIMELLFTVDEEHLIFYQASKRIGWVFLVYGNDGWDVINDYSTTLEAVLEAKSVADRIKYWEDRV
jgi:hypothetical protein